MAQRFRVAVKYKHFSRALVFALVCIALHLPAIAQEKTSSSADQELQRLADAQRSARDAGDPTKVRDTSLQLAAYALRSLADLKTAEESYSEAQDLYKQSLVYADEPQTHQQRVIAFLLAKQNDAALAEAQQAVQLAPDNAQAWLMLGRLQAARDDNKPAVQSLERSLSLHPDIKTAYALAAVHLKMHDTTGADQIFKLILQQAGEHADLHLLFGNAYREADDLTSAIREFKAAVALEPSSAIAHLTLGQAYWYLNQWQYNGESLKEFQEAVRLAPDDYLANFNLGVIESQYKMYADSDRHLQAASRIDPGNPDPWLNLGANAFAGQNSAGARASLRKAIELTGKNDARNDYQIRRAYLILSRLDVEAGDLQSAQKLYDIANQLKQKSKAAGGEQIEAASVSNAPPSVTSQNNAAKSRPNASSDDLTRNAPAAPTLTPAELEQLHARAARLRTVLGTALTDCGTAEARMHDYAQALQHFQAAQRWTPNDPVLSRNIGLAAFQAGDYPTSIHALTEAITRQPDDALARAFLGRSLFATKRYAEAARSLAPLADSIYSDPTLAYTYAVALARSQQEAPARAVLARLLELPLPPAAISQVCQVYVELKDRATAGQCLRRSGGVQSPDNP